MRHFRISDQNPIKTKRLLLTPLNAKQLAALEAEETDELLRGVLGEMRKNVTDYHDLALWHTGWQISLRTGGQVVGLLGFHGVAVNQTVEIGYEIREAFRGNGYGEEAIKARAKYVDSLIKKNNRWAEAFEKISQSTITWALIAFLGFLAMAVWHDIVAAIKMALKAKV